ncbi:MAG: serine/threonine protein kinase [Chitinophagaceae bacterium]|jgi:GAF domain-containing protein|nr:serine/threonine protein kinase [Chitinophagaceae bacterium]
MKDWLITFLSLFMVLGIGICGEDLMKNHFIGKDLLPANEKERLNVVRQYLEEIPEGYFGNLAAIMAKSFNTPIALVSFVDKEEVAFLGNFGMEDSSRVSRGLSLCSLAILDDSPTIFPDALKEPCLLANPLVTGSFGLRFYAGAPIITKEGYAIGTACIVDKEPRTFSKEDIGLLEYFARVAMQEVEMRVRMLKQLA